MSISTISGSDGKSDIGQLVRRLVTAADSNQDGDLSMSEFGSFLHRLIDGLNVDPGKTTNAASAANDSVAAAVGVSAAAASQASQLSRAPAGWDQTKWADPEHRTTKYNVGHVLAKFPTTVAGLKDAWVELSVLYPEATFDGKDTISGLPGTNGPVDVLVGASDGGRAWAWQDPGV
jgi:hypothetical protein